MHAAVGLQPEMCDSARADADARIRLLVPDMPPAAALLPHLDRIDASEWYTNFGPLVRELEDGLIRELAKISGPGVRAATTSSGTTALEEALMALGLRPKARVAVPSLTFPGTATAVVRAGCVPVLCEVDPESWLLTPSIAYDVLDRTNVDAVLPVATFGAPQPAEGWDVFTVETGVPVLIDAAGAFGEQRVGNFSVATFSLHATKAFGVGEGGLVASRREQIVEAVRSSSNFGIEKGLCEIAGTNAKMSEYHAAVGLAQLERWAEIRERRQRLWNSYERALTRHVGERAVVQRRTRPLAPTLMIVRLPVDSAAVGRHLRAAGIETRAWYCPPLHRQPAFANAPRVGRQDADELLVTDYLGSRLLGLPFHRGLREDDVDYVCRTLAHALDEMV